MANWGAHGGSQFRLWQVIGNDFANFFLSEAVRADAAGVILGLSKDLARSSDNAGKEICEGLSTDISKPYRPLFLPHLSPEGATLPLKEG